MDNIQRISFMEFVSRLAQTVVPVATLLYPL